MSAVAKIAKIEKIRTRAVGGVGLTVGVGIRGLVFMSIMINATDVLGISTIVHCHCGRRPLPD
jgi:hypothetical protein